MQGPCPHFHHPEQAMAVHVHSAVAGMLPHEPQVLLAA
jgi:hypothetical protein